MQKITLILLSFLLPLMALAQSQKDTTLVVPQITTSSEDDEIFTVIEEEPSFPGGEKGRAIFLSKNIIYPIEARKNNIEGIVYVSFVVEKDGSVTKAKILRDVGGGLGEEALRVVKLMPKWIPGKQRGKYVRVWFTMPIKFELRD